MTISPMKEPAKTVLARNIAFMLRSTGLDAQEVAIRANVGIRTLANMKAGQNARIDTVEAVARVFGLPARALLSPTLPADLESQDWLDRARRIFGLDGQPVELVKRAIEAAETIANLPR